MSRYLASTRSAYYGVVAAIPLLVAYELLLVGGAGGMPVSVRNAADVWLRMILIQMGVRPSHVTLGMILVLILSIPVVRRPGVPLRGRYVALLLLEAFAYSLGLAVVIQGILRYLLAPLIRGQLALADLLALPALQVHPWMAGNSLMQNLALSLGAGLFEEFVFRVVLYTALLALLRVVFAGWFSRVLAILAASFLFALAHHIGPLGEPFDIYAFLFRWVAGMLFTGLFSARGFAVTAYAHALYDIRVVMM